MSAAEAERSTPGGLRRLLEERPELVVSTALGVLLLLTSGRYG